MRKPVLLVMVQFVMFAVMLAAVMIFPARAGTVLSRVGMLLMLAGAGTGLYAIREHPSGPRVSPEPKRGASMVQSGPYRWVRHPIYTGVLLATLGVAVAHGHPTLYLIFAIFVIFFTYKSRYEESLLMKAYPDYVDYMARTGRFLPPFNSIRNR